MLSWRDLRTIFLISFITFLFLDDFLFITQTVAWLSMWNKIFVFARRCPQIVTATSTEKMSYLSEFRMQPTKSAIYHVPISHRNKYQNQGHFRPHYLYKVLAALQTSINVVALMWRHYRHLKIVTTQVNPLSYPWSIWYGTFVIWLVDAHCGINQTSAERTPWTNHFTRKI